VTNVGINGTCLARYKHSEENRTKIFRSRTGDHCSGFSVRNPKSERTTDGVCGTQRDRVYTRSFFFFKRLSAPRVFLFIFLLKRTSGRRHWLFRVGPCLLVLVAVIGKRRKSSWHGVCFCPVQPSPPGRDDEPNDFVASRERA